MADSCSELSDDDDLDQDMEELRKACRINTQIPNYELSESSDNSDDDDLALMRDIQQRFALSEPTPLPDWSSDDNDFDFESLRAIQRRFAAYNNEDGSKDMHDSLQRPTKVSTSEMETSTNCLFVKEGNNIGQGFLDSVDTVNEGGEHESQVVSDTDESSRKKYEFPQSAHAFFGSILKNRACQIHIKRMMGEMETRIEDLEKVIKKVKLVKDLCRKRTGRALLLNRDACMQLISLPMQRMMNAKIDEGNVHAMYKGPTDNSHVPTYNKYMANVSVSQVKWSKEENRNLLKGLKQQFQNKLFQQSAEANNVNSIGSIKDLDITPERIRLFLPEVDWETLAAMYVPRRSGGECQARYLNWEDPLIDHDPWTEIETNTLLDIVQQKGPHNWVDIAASLGINRTPFQCLAHFHMNRNAEMPREKWTKEEDNQLRAAVETYGENDWQAVASVMERRTGARCSDRWLYTLNPARTREGRFTTVEDKLLRVAVTIIGPKSWNRIANFVPGRTQRQCRDRWKNSLDSNVDMGKWSEEEDAKLKAAVAEHGTGWSKIAKCIPRRTDNQCWRRWKALFQRKARQAARSGVDDGKSERRPLLKHKKTRKLRPMRKGDKGSVNGNNTDKRKVLKTCSSEPEKLLEMENGTASYLRRLRPRNPPGNKSEVQPRFSESDLLITDKRRKRKLGGSPNNGGNPCKRRQVLNTGDDDDETLAQLYRKLKKK